MRYEVEINRLGALALFDLKGAEEALAAHAGDALPPFPEGPNTSSVKEGIHLLHIGPEHWLLWAPMEDEALLIEGLRPEEAPPEISVVRVSDTMTFFAVTGRDAAQILAIASPLDIHPSVFPENGATFTEAFGLKALVMRCEGGFRLAVEQSFGDMIDAYLARATA